MLFTAATEAIAQSNRFWVSALFKLGHVHYWWLRRHASALFLGLRVPAKTAQSSIARLRRESIECQRNLFPLNVQSVMDMFQGEIYMLTSKGMLYRGKITRHKLRFPTWVRTSNRMTPPLYLPFFARLILMIRTNYTPAANDERQLRKLKTKTVKSEKCVRTR